MFIHELIRPFLVLYLFFTSFVLLSIKHTLSNVTVDFTTHGGSHIYGIPWHSTDSLYPMDHFCTFDVPKIIPKNMQ